MLLIFTIAATAIFQLSLCFIGFYAKHYKAA